MDPGLVALGMHVRSQGSVQDRLMVIERHAHSVSQSTGSVIFALHSLGALEKEEVQALISLAAGASRAGPPAPSLPGISNNPAWYQSLPRAVFM